jgi:hypothetical protein
MPTEATGLEPVTPIKLKEFSITERADFKRCRRRWFLGTAHRLERRGGGMALPFGTAIHAGLEAYYRERNNPVAKRLELAKEAFHSSWYGEMDAVSEFLGGALWGRIESEYTEMDKLGDEMLEGYAREYGSDPDWADVMTQEVRLRFKVPGTNMWVTGKLDITIRVTSRRGRIHIEVWDNKTASSAYNPNHLDIDDQLSGYAWLHEKANGVVPDVVGHNTLLKKGPLTKSGKPTTSQLFARDQSFRTKAQILEWEANLTREAKDMRKVAAHPELAYPTPSAMNCNGCPVRMLCVAMMNREDTEDLITSSFVIADPRP